MDTSRADAGHAPASPTDARERGTEPAALERLLEQLAAQACDLLGADYAAIAIRSLAGETVWRAVAGALQETRPSPIVPMGEGLADRAMVADGLVVMEGFPDHPGFPPARYRNEAAQGTRSAVAAPLRDRQGETLGALIAGWRSAIVVGPRRAELAKALAEPAGLAIENARLLHEASVARERAEAADAAKSRFLSMVTHELKTPLNAILGYTELLELGVDGPVSDVQRARLERVRQAGRHMVGLVTDLLDLSRIESGRLEVHVDNARASDAVSAALILTSPQAVSAGVTITAACRPAADAWYRGDPSRVKQVVANLLSNAVKFTEEGGTVGVTCGVANHPDPAAAVGQRGGDAQQWVYVQVSDTGIGIPADKLGLVFEPFKQIEDGRTRSKGGTGLGLTISRHLARLMAGDLTVASEPGQGSTFTLWLPAVPAGAADAELRKLHAAAGRVGGLAATGKALEARTPAITSAFARRLRDEPLVPNGATVTTSQLEDHVGVFLADLAKALLILEEGKGEPTLMRDGSEIQHVIADLHGAQRHRLGWPEAALGREFDILREEVAEALGFAAVPESERAGPPELLMALLDKAERVSLVGYRRAAAAVA